MAYIPSAGCAYVGLSILLEENLVLFAHFKSTWISDPGCLRTQFKILAKEVTVLLCSNDFDHLHLTLHSGQKLFDLYELERNLLVHWYHPF